MARATRQGARHVVRRALGRALLVAGGTLGGTLLSWAVATGSAHAADAHTAPPVDQSVSATTQMIGPVLDAPAGALNQLSGPTDAARLDQSAAPSTLSLAPNALADPTVLPAAMRDQLIGGNSSLRSTTDGVLHTLAPAGRTVRGVAGALTTAAPVRLDTAPGALLSTLNRPLAEDTTHNVPPKHPVRDDPAPAATPQAPAAQPAAQPITVPGALPAEAHHPYLSVADGVTSPGRHHTSAPAEPTRPAPFGPFAPAPAAPLPASATGPAFVPVGASPGAVHQQYDRDTALPAVALSAPGDVDHRIGSPAVQPGVTPD